MKSVAVYCGSSIGANPLYAQQAQALGAALAAQGLTLVYGGGRVGLMGTIADAVLAAGGQVIGVIPDFLHAKEVSHTGCTELHIVGSMHERKLLMAESADAFVAMPGGTGTLEELFETFTWLQLGLHSKPIGLLDVAGYWQPLVALMDHAVEAGFVRRDHADAMLVRDHPAELLDAFGSWLPPHHDKW